MKPRRMIVVIGTATTLAVESAVSPVGHDPDHDRRHVDHAPAGHERLIVATTSAQSFDASGFITLVADNLEYTPGAASDSIHRIKEWIRQHLSPQNALVFHHRPGAHRFVRWMDQIVQLNVCCIGLTTSCAGSFNNFDEHAADIQTRRPMAHDKVRTGVSIQWRPCLIADGPAPPVHVFPFHERQRHSPRGDRHGRRRVIIIDNPRLELQHIGWTLRRSIG